MCKWIKSGNIRIDPCMKEVIDNLKKAGATPLACCCGHGKYHKSIVVEIDDGTRREYYTGVLIPRFSRFYVRDEAKVFFIPESEKAWALNGVKESSP